MWENPRAFNEALLSFLDEIEAGANAAEPAFTWGLAGWTNGIAHRAAGRRRDVVLVHGLGMSSAYFGRFARALFALGANPIAPDLPGFGESIDGPPAGPEEHARILGEWADSLSIHDAVWIGHSLGCNAVVHLQRMRPDLVRSVVCIGPLWSARRPSWLLGSLLIDAFREPLPLYSHVVRAYLRCGLGRWVATFRRYTDDLRSAPPDNADMLAGQNDPLTDRSAISQLVLVPGAHACHYSHAEETARLSFRIGETAGAEGRAGAV
jgi:pimeloyl-ACP methyl ester carboxylesterase